MGHVGKRAGVLRRLLAQAGLEPVVSQLPRPTGAEHHAELLELYRALGGLIELPVWRPGGWDLIFEGPLVVELDEQLHFNRYRARTLNASWASDLPWAEDYRRYCADHEGRCLQDGCGQQRWTNRSSARNFAGGPVGDLDVGGAPRWKQRAFYDALKDTAHAAGMKATMARVAIYDTVDEHVLDGILQDHLAADPAAVLALVQQRSVAPDEFRRSSA